MRQNRMMLSSLLAPPHHRRPFPSFPFNSCVFCFLSLAGCASHLTTIEVSALSGQPCSHLCISTVRIPGDAASSLMRIVTGEQSLLVTVLCVQRSERIGTFVCLFVSSLLLSLDILNVACLFYDKKGGTAGGPDPPVVILIF